MFSKFFFYVGVAGIPFVFVVAALATLGTGENYLIYTAEGSTKGCA